ncbi:hypothetical protein ACJX0J_026594, partial [Zea mays]
STLETTLQCYSANSLITPLPNFVHILFHLGLCIGMDLDRLEMASLKAQVCSVSF